ncbi:MAG: SDR family NAD(P)-dependent oxidoreductase [Alphaproteobacteria bacterium]|nr:SDR family NAD(P)-dependent oxidoreductase [Alphaproteobacteria bacterium]MDE2631057.1 SDR family NAD(P)-dependent oxidoreductase [Alphaproteobacteria bacterium]
MSAKTILITGASSGIGASLARVYAAQGARLVLWGRNEERLNTTAAECRARGAQIETTCFDLAELNQIVENLEAADTRNPFDLVIFNAGLGGSLPRDRAAQDVGAAERMAGVNFTAPVVGANLIAERMAKRGRGRIVFIGSIAESFPLPMAPLYAGTKAGLALFAEALELRLAKYGVRVTLVSPGFVDTPMSRSLREPRPFLIGADEAAAIIARKIERGARRIVVPWQFAVIRAAAGLVPRAIMRAVLARAAR